MFTNSKSNTLSYVDGNLFFVLYGLHTRSKFFAYANAAQPRKAKNRLRRTCLAIRGLSFNFNVINTKKRFSIQFYSA